MGQCLGSEVTKEMKTARIRSTQIDQELYQSAIRKMNVVKREREISSLLSCMLCSL